MCNNYYLDLTVKMSYYIKNAVLQIDEDDQWEFKAHRNFSCDEVPVFRLDGTKICPSLAMAEFMKTKNANRTRQPISRNLCGFLNSGKGGTILIGVLDSGTVAGVSLNVLQQDHLLLSVEDALRRFVPQVPTDFIKVSFKPVLNDPSEFQFLAEQAHLNDPSKELRQNPHQLRTSSKCWCDVMAARRLDSGFVAPLYVVEVKVAALHPNLRTPEISKRLAQLMKGQPTSLMNLSWPAFTGEDGNIFCKVLNSLVKYTEEEIFKMNLMQTEFFIQDELSNMDSNCAQIQKLQSLIPQGAVVSKTYLQSILDHLVETPNTDTIVKTNSGDVQPKDLKVDTQTISTSEVTNKNTETLQSPIPEKNVTPEKTQKIDVEMAMNDVSNVTLLADLLVLPQSESDCISTPENFSTNNDN